MDKKTILKEIIADEHEDSKSNLNPRDLELPIDSGMIVVVSGVRRSGKTSLLKITRDKLIANGTPIINTLFLSFDDERLILNTDELDLILQAYQELYPDVQMGECYLFLDEIQNISYWEKFIRRVFDTKTKRIFLSGSNSKQLGSEIATSLRGRTLRYELYPLSFREYLSFRNTSLNYHSSGNKSRILNNFYQYTHNGGFPEIVNRKKEESLTILTDYYQVLLFRDIIERYNLSKTYLLKPFIQRMFATLTKPFSINKIFKELKSQGLQISKDNLYEITEYIEAVYLAKRMYKFNYSVLNRQMSDKKVYCIDNGLLNAITFKFSKDDGKLFENMIAIWLWSNQNSDIFYFKGKSECDFVLFDRDKPSYCIQASFNISTSTTLQREIKGLTEAMDYFGIADGVVLTAEVEQQMKVNNKWIHIMPAYKTMIDNKMI